MSAPLLRTEPLRAVAFVGRPHRFGVDVLDGDERRRAFVANPGKMGEILLPESTLLAASRPDTRTGLEVVAATWTRRWPGDRARTVLLHTGRVNDVAEALLRRRSIPALADARIVRREHPWRGARIDFLLERAGRPYLLEVKSATLVEHGLALFPDARTDRGRHHLELLASRDRTHDAGVLFVVQGHAERFLPDIHNDEAFARSLLAARSRVDLLPVAVDTQRLADGRVEVREPARELPIPWTALERALPADGDEPASLAIELLEVGGDGEDGGVERRGHWALVHPHARGRRRSLLERELALHASSRRSLLVVAPSSSLEQVARALREGLGGERLETNDATVHALRFERSLYRTAGFQRLLTTWRVQWAERCP